MRGRYQNMNMLIRNHQQTILQLMAQGEAQLKEMSLIPYAEEIALQMEESRQRAVPTIMFYGLYNAGKSTLINALCKQTVAKVGDVPTTASIQQIPWSGYTLTDTPGINANDEHTQIATAEVDRSDLVLFVMDNMDGFERDVVYQVIVDILKRGKALAIVVNQKSINDQEDSNLCVSALPSMQKISEKILENLDKCGKRNQIDFIGHTKNFLGIFLINANTALEANKYAGTEAGKLLYDNSGIHSLVNAMNGSIAASNQIRMLQTPIVFLKTKLTEGLTHYRDSMDMTSSSTLSKERRLLAESRQRASDSALEEGLRKIDVCFEQVRSATANGQSYEEFFNQLESDLSTILSTIAEKEIKLLKQELRALNIDDDSSNNESNDINVAELLDAGIAIGEIVRPITGVMAPPDINVIVDATLLVIKVIREILGSMKNPSEEEARKSAERLAAYYKWLNELRDYEATTKANYKTEVEAAIAEAYDSRIRALEEKLEHENQNFTTYNANVHRLEVLLYQVNEEIAELSLAL